MRKWVVLALVATGCGGSSGSMLIDPGPPPANGLQIVLPVIKDVQPGTDNEYCTWTNVIADHDLYVKSVEGFQSLSGHHIVVYKTQKMQPPGTTRICTDEDMTNLRFVAGAGGEGIKDINQAPGDLAFTIEKGSQIVINHHYINASPTAHDVQSAVDLNFADPGAHIIPAGAMAIVDTNLHLDPGQPSVDIDCTMQKAVKVWYSIPHMHAYGLDITVDHTANGQTTRLFDTPWNPTYTFHPPVHEVDPSQAELFNVGDNVHVHCVWDNTTGGQLTFGIEMCVFFAQTVDDSGVGSIACDQGNWTSF